MSKKILIAVLLLILAFVVVVALQPSTFSVARSTTIAAPVADVFPNVNDFHKWEAWSPWAKLDPDAKVSFEGPPEGTGTVMTWSGNDKVGEGKMTLVDSAPDEHVNIKVDFVKRGQRQQRLRLQNRRWSDASDLDHVRRARFHRQGILPRHERHQNDGRRHRQGRRAIEVGGGKRDRALRGGAMNFDAKTFYLNADGRVNRQQWWLRLIVPVIVIELVLSFVDMAIGTYDHRTGGGVLSGLFALAVLIPSIIVYIKRFHDRDKSGWWVLIGLVPLIGQLWLLIELGFLAGTPGPNRFGPPVTD
jgi:uncharacterized membrane protein YhaH (DUF805 family)